MVKEMDSTESQVRCILSPTYGGLSVEDVKALGKKRGFYTKYGADFALMLEDAARRGDAVLIVHLAGDDSRSSINAYLAAHQKEKLGIAIKAVAAAMHAKEIYMVKTAETDDLFNQHSIENENVKNDGKENAEIKIITVNTERSFVLREESALYNDIENGEIRSCPREKEFPSQGLQGRPTVVLDAETLCRIYEAAKPNYVESKLIVLHNAGESRLAEVKTGTSLCVFLKECGLEPEKSVLVGGVTGEFVAKEQLDQKKVGICADWDSIAVYGEKDCMAGVTRQLAEQAKQESCGKCVLCREGTWHFQAYAQDLTQGKAKKEDLAMILDIGPLIQAGALCSFGQKMARAVVSAVEQNRLELEAHVVKKTCPAGVCRAFAKLVIDPSKCTGCGDCMDVCDEDAITGKKKFIHIIDPDLCEICGKCAKACEENAVVMQDGTIRIPKKPVKAGTVIRRKEKNMSKL